MNRAPTHAVACLLLVCACSSRAPKAVDRDATVATATLDATRREARHDAASQASVVDATSPLTEGRWEELSIVGAVSGQSTSATGTVLVYLPKGYGACALPLVIALHGWGHEPATWKERPNFAQLADRWGVVLALPAMAHSVYESVRYPESRATDAPAPGLPWIGEVVLPALRARLAVDPTRSRTAIIGYSTGGRGALLVATRYSEFKFAASLSGTYDLFTLDPTTGEYRIHEKVFGSRSAFPDRWRIDDISDDDVARLKDVALYLAHGARDDVVPASQLEDFAERMRTHNVEAETRIDEHGGHGWQFWDEQLPDVFAAMGRAVGPSCATK